MFTKLLVPLDGSELAEQAVAVAATIARAAHASIELVMVEEPLSIGAEKDMPWENAEWAADQRYLDGIAAELSRGASLLVTSAVVRGNAAEMICERAREIGAELIVLTSHGRTGLSRLWLGSVADAAVRHSTIPVLMLRPDESAPNGRSRHAFQRILLPFDGSPFASEILETAASLAWASHAGLILLRVVAPVPLISTPDRPGARSQAVVDQIATGHLVDEFTIELRDVASQLSHARNVPVSADVIVSSRTADAVVEYAKRHSIDLIAMSTRGRGASRWVIGSVADKVLRASDIPVLLRRPVGSPAARALVTDDSVAEQLPALGVPMSVS